MKAIPNYPGYFVTKCGKVWSGPKGINNTTGKWLKGTAQNKRSGHLVINLWKNKKPKTQYIHRLVLEAFVGPCPEGMECRHLDGNPQNNNLSNLCWGTDAENCADRKRHGTENTGEKQGRSKLTEQNVRMIIYIQRTGELARKEIAKIFSVSPGTISDIKYKRSWKHIWRIST